MRVAGWHINLGRPEPGPAGQDAFPPGPGQQGLGEVRVAMAGSLDPGPISGGSWGPIPDCGLGKGEGSPHLTNHRVQTSSRLSKSVGSGQI